MSSFVVDGRLKFEDVEPGDLITSNEKDCVWFNGSIVVSCDDDPYKETTTLSYVSMKSSKFKVEKLTIYNADHIRGMLHKVKL